MAKYDVSVTLKVDGKPDARVTCCCPDETCFAECERAYVACGSAMIAFHQASPTSASQPVKGKKAKVATKVLKDGKEFMDEALTYHDLPDAAVAELENQFRSFMGCGAMKTAKAVKSP